MFLTGTSGYSYSYWGPFNPKINNFYQSKTHQLPQYSQLLQSVEIVCTKYSKLTPKMCTNWFNITPDNFRFTIKAPTYITHYSKLNNFEQWWNEFLPNIKALDYKFTCLLFQFSPRFMSTTDNIQKLQNVQNIIPNNIDVAFEFRHDSWYQSNIEINKLFQVSNWAFVTLNVPEIKHLKINFGNLNGGTHYGIPPTRDGFKYYRFHGTTNYSDGTYGLDRLLSIINLSNDNKLSRNSSKTRYITDNSESLKNHSDCRKTLCYFNNVDTWIIPDSELGFEGTYKGRIFPKKHFVPSAIYDAIILQNWYQQNTNLSFKIIIENKHKSIKPEHVSIKCSGLTKKGSPCKLKTKDNSGTCHLHRIN